MTSKQKWALVHALEAIQGQLHDLDFYGQAAQDSLERLQGTVTREQRADIGRLDHAIQLSREHTRDVRVALEAALRSALKRRRKSNRRSGNRQSVR